MPCSDCLRLEQDHLEAERRMLAHFRGHAKAVDPKTELHEVWDGNAILEAHKGPRSGCADCLKGHRALAPLKKG